MIAKKYWWLNVLRLRLAMNIAKLHFWSSLIMTICSRWFWDQLFSIKTETKVLNSCLLCVQMALSLCILLSQDTALSTVSFDLLTMHLKSFHSSILFNLLNTILLTSALPNHSRVTLCKFLSVFVFVTVFVSVFVLNASCTNNLTSALPNQSRVTLCKFLVSI